MCVQFAYYKNIIPSITEAQMKNSTLVLRSTNFTFTFHGYTVHQQYPHFNFQLMHTTLKNIGLLKHFKISKTAPTCFGLQGNHHQGATASTWLKLHIWL